MSTKIYNSFNFHSDITKLPFKTIFKLKKQSAHETFKNQAGYQGWLPFANPELWQELYHCPITEK